MTINGSMLRDMILTGAALLDKNKKSVDALNVFPVPDGDTGINMSLTIGSAAREVSGVSSESCSVVAQALAKGALMGARGNSGVILSQIFRGFQRAVDGNETIDAALFAQALRGGADTAYKAVMKPREGTILTVIRAMADEAQRQARAGVTDLPQMLDAVLVEGERILQKTPEMLPVLKEAGVVDAGGVGLMLVFTGFKRALDGEELDDAVYEFTAPAVQMIADVEEGEDSAKDIEFGYCTEFFVVRLHEDVNEESRDRLRDKLAAIGDSLIVVGDDTMIKVHVHTNQPGKALQLALRLGELSKIKIDNMREQHRSITMDEAQHAAISSSHTPHAEQPQQPQKEFGMVAVAMGEGVAQIFRDLMVDEVVEGGQTMNPSIQDIADAAKRANAKKVFVFPNNTNIILAAQQAVELCDFELAVIPSKSIPQGVSAALAFHPDMAFDENVRRMNDAIGTVKTGQVTYAVRDSSFDGKEIHNGDIMGLAEGKIKVVGSAVDQVTLDLLAEMADDDSEILTLYYGSDVTAEDAEALGERIGQQYPDMELEIHSGGQPLYYYILSLE